MGISDRLKSLIQPKSWPETMKELNDEFDRRELQAQSDAEMKAVFTPGPNAHPAPVFIHPVQQRWFFCSLGVGAFYFGFYGTGLLSA